MATVTDLSNLLATRSGFQVLDTQPSENQIRMVGRVPPNASQYWVLIIHRMLVASENLPWKVDVSRNYFTRDSGNGQKRLFYTWRLIFQGNKIQAHLKSIIDTINSAPRPARVELQEFPLTGVQRNHANGKGAFSAETTPMVAGIAAQARMGGIRT